MYQKVKQAILTRVKKYYRRCLIAFKVHLNHHFRYDLKKYKRHSSTYLNDQNVRKIGMELRMLIHSIEKGLSLPNPRIGFGKQKAQRILDLLRIYQTFSNDSRYDPDTYNCAVEALFAYVQHCKQTHVDVTFVEQELNFEKIDSAENHGVLNLTKNDVEQAAKTADFFTFAHSRHSLRQFSDEPVTKEELENAVELAQTAPSACNRQSVRIYAALDEDKVDQLTKLQGGAVGFGQMRGIVVLTSDLSLYADDLERNAAFIDGGIFAMNLCYALHYYQIGSCILQWGQLKQKDRKLHELLHIPENEQAVCFVGLGKYPDGEFKVAQSKRRPVNQILHLV